MKVILSIKPEYADLIFDGSKKYEYRRKIFKRPVKSVVLYATEPISKVVGEFEIKEVILKDIDNLWSETKKHSGISEDFFYSYFSGQKQGYAIKIGRILHYPNPKCIKKDFSLNVPQSFQYLEEV